MSAERVWSVIACLLTCLAASSLLAADRAADVVVIDNRTAGDIPFSLERAGAAASKHVLHGGQVIPLEISGKSVIYFQSEGVPRHYVLQPKSIYSFRSFPGEIDLEKLSFPAKGQPLRQPVLETPPEELADRPAPDFKPGHVIPVKILVDEEQLAARGKWEKDLRRTMQAASDVIQRHCGLQFEVQSVDVWHSDNRAAGPHALQEDFALKVDPRPAWLAIGFTSQQKAPRNKAEQHPVRLFDPHIVIRDWQPAGNEAERVEVLVHALGHYLGAIDSAEPTSVMRPLAGDYRVRSQKFPLQFDALNTLLLNVVADQLRAAGPTPWQEMPPRLQQQLSALWTAAERRPAQSAEPRRVDTARKPAPTTNRFSAVFMDADQVIHGHIYDWGRNAEKPLLDNRPLLDGKRPIRWLRNDELKMPAAPRAFVELVGGDRVPGKVVEYRAHEDLLSAAAAAGKSATPGLPAHLVVEPTPGLVMHRASQTPEIRVLMPWLRRIVWQRTGVDRYEPNTIRLRSGGSIAFRSLQFTQHGVKLLLEDGMQQFPFADVGEVHLPAVDPWLAYYQQLAVLSPSGKSRLVRWETMGGLRATASEERLQTFDGTQEYPDNWIHLLQPAWSLDPLYARHQTIRLRTYFSPQEVPLSIVDPVATERHAVFSGAWDWHADRNCRGGTLRSAGEEFAWGFGVQATSELQFDLPPLAKSVRTRVGLDRLAGRGGCARAIVYVDSQQRPPLYRSPLLLGSRTTHDSGWLPLGTEVDNTAPRRLILVADMAAGDRPTGADPLDIRDTLDWLEPLVALDADRLQQQVDQHLPRMIDAWAGWTLAEGKLQLENRWDKSNARRPTYRLDVQPQGKRLVLSRTLQVTSITNRLLVGVSRSRNATASRIEILINGERIGGFTVTARGEKTSATRSISLKKYVGQQVKIEVAQLARDDRSQVEWHSLAIVE